MGYPVYDAGAEKFVENFYKSDLFDPEYSETHEKFNAKTSKLGELIETADMDLLKAILTFYIRSERFCEGTWADAVENETFLRILSRISTLKEV